MDNQINNQVQQQVIEAQNGDVNKVCKQCGTPFVIRESEVNWLKERKLELFARCYSCRKKRKQEKEEFAAKMAAGNVPIESKNAFDMDQKMAEVAQRNDFAAEVLAEADVEKSDFQRYITGERAEQQSEVFVSSEVPRCGVDFAQGADFTSEPETFVFEQEKMEEVNNNDDADQ